MFFIRKSYKLTNLHTILGIYYRQYGMSTSFKVGHLYKSNIVKNLCMAYLY